MLYTEYDIENALKARQEDGIKEGIEKDNKISPLILVSKKPYPRKVHKSLINTSELSKKIWFF